MNTINTIWDLNKFDKINYPYVLPSCLKEEDKVAFSTQKGIRVLDIPVKFPNTEYKIPSYLNQFLPVIDVIKSHSHSINSNIDAYFCYITVDQGIVEKGKSQRVKGCHVDGFQGIRVNPKVEIDYGYVVSDALPTKFYLQPFPVKNLDYEKHNFFEAFQTMAVQNKVWIPKDYDIVLLDSYVVHESPVTDVEKYRTFFRMTYSVRKYDRAGNTKNDLFDYTWDYKTRDIPKFNVDKS